MLKSSTGIITKENLLALRDFIQKRVGLFFPESKLFAIENHIHANLLDSPYDSFSKYVLYLNSKDGENHFKKLISLLTTNETFFFRGKDQFKVLEKHILPELIEKEANKSKTIRIWSAGCSTGEEPYSLAILLKKIIPCIDTWNIKIISTDVDEAVLQKARKGEYGYWSFRGVNNKIIDRSFIRENDIYKIKNEYKSLVQFNANNLTLDSPPDTGLQKKEFDLIICRNVTIYFKKETTKALASKFYSALRKGGCLLVGHAEHSAENYSLFNTRAFPNAIVYQKEDEKTSEDRIQLYIDTVHLKDNKKRKRKISRIKDTSQKPTIREKSDLINMIKERNVSDFSRSDKITLSKHRNTSSEETQLFDKAIHYYNNKNYELAVDRFLNIIDTNPSNVRACWMLSHIAANRGYFEEATDWANRCLEIDSLFREAYYTLSLIHLAKGELNEAERKIQKAIYIDQNFILGYFMLGNIYILKQIQTQADKYYKMVKDMLDSKPLNEIIFQAEHLTVGELLNLIELKARKT